MLPLSNSDLGRLVRLFVITLILAWAAPAPGQGTKADYERSASLRALTRGKVFRDRIEPTWSKDGKRLWYRVQTGADRYEFVLVDAAKGTRRLVFDHEKMAKALIGAGMDGARADRLPISEFDLDREAGSVVFRIGSMWWRCDLKSYALAKLTKGRGTAKAEALRSVADGPRASGSNGSETHVTFRNLTKGPVELFWLDQSGQRRSYGKIAAGAERRQRTFANHVWLVVDAQGKALGVFQAGPKPAQVEVTGKSARPAARIASFRQAETSVGRKPPLGVSLAGRTLDRVCEGRQRLAARDERGRGIRPEHRRQA